jgi:hypothetical protein
MRGIAVLGLAWLIGTCAFAAGKPLAVPEHAVIVHFSYGHKDWSPFFKFEETLEKAVNASGLGDYDGNELAVDGSDGTLYMYGPDADRLFAFVKPYLESARILKDIEVTLRYGAADDDKARVSKFKVRS